MSTKKTDKQNSESPEDVSHDTDSSSNGNWVSNNRTLTVAIAVSGVLALALLIVVGNSGSTAPAPSTSAPTLERHMREREAAQLIWDDNGAEEKAIYCDGEQWMRETTAEIMVDVTSYDVSKLNQSLLTTYVVKAMEESC